MVNALDAVNCCQCTMDQRVVTTRTQEIQVSIIKQFTILNTVFS